MAVDEPRKPLKVSLTGFQLVDVRAYIMEITAKGFIYDGSLKQSTDVLVAKHAGTTKWAAALEAGIPVVSVMWLKSSQEGCLGDVERYRLKKFEGLTICTTKLSLQERKEVAEIVEANGGVFSPNLSQNVSMLIVPDSGVFDETEKSTFAKRQGIPLVRASWIHQVASLPTPPTWTAYSLCSQTNAAVDPTARRAANTEVAAIQTSTSSVVPPGKPRGILEGIHFRTPLCVPEAIKHLIQENGGTTGQVYTVTPHSESETCEDCQVTETVTEEWIRRCIEHKTVYPAQGFGVAMPGLNDRRPSMLHIKVHILDEVPEKRELLGMCTAIGCSVTESPDDATHIVCLYPEDEIKGVVEGGDVLRTCCVTPRWVRDSYGTGVPIDRAGYTRCETAKGSAAYEATPVQETPLDKGSELLNLVSKFEDAPASGSHAGGGFLTPEPALFLSRASTAKRASRVDLCTDDERDRRLSPLPGSVPPPMMDESQVIRFDDGDPVDVHTSFLPQRALKEVRSASMSVSRPVPPPRKYLYIAAGTTIGADLSMLPPHNVTTNLLEATHIVCEKVSKTVHVLAGIAGGKWVVTPSWLEETEKGNSWAPEVDFVHRMTGLRGNTAAIAASAEGWRAKSGGAYKDWAATILSEGKTAAQYATILECGGATVVSASSGPNIVIYPDTCTVSKVTRTMSAHPSASHLRADALWLVLVNPNLSLSDPSLSALEHARQRESRRASTSTTPRRSGSAHTPSKRQRVS